MSIKLIDCIPSPTGKQYYTVPFFGWRCIILTAVFKVCIVLVPNKKKQRLLVIMFIPEFMCYIVQSISIVIISKLQRFFALM